MPFVKRSDDKLRSIKLEYNTVEHCNYACRECSHMSPHMPVRYSGLDVFRADLEALGAVYHVDRFRFVGGEPLLHPELVEFIRSARASGIADTIEIVTNGSRLDKVPDAVFRDIDYLSISWYDDARCDQARIDRAEDRCREHGTTLKVKRAGEFRMMQLTEPISDPDLVVDVYQTCQIAHSWYCQTFLDGRFYLCSRPLFTAAYLKQRNQPAPDLKHLDGVALHEPDLRHRLQAYLSREEPLESCRHCLGTVGKRIEWGQMPLAERRSTAPLDRRADDAVSTPILTYLRRWARVERALLRLIPSLRLARTMTLVKEVTMRAVSENEEKRYPRWRSRLRRRLTGVLRTP